MNDDELIYTLQIYFDCNKNRNESVILLICTLIQLCAIAYMIMPKIIVKSYLNNTF